MLLLHLPTLAGYWAVQSHLAEQSLNKLVFCSLLFLPPIPTAAVTSSRYHLHKKNDCSVIDYVFSHYVQC